MTTAILPTLLSQPSSQHLAYARATVRCEDLAELLASMANASGGMIVIGVNPRTQKAEGVIDVEQTSRLVLDAAAMCSPTLVIPMPLQIEHANQMLIFVNVPSGLPNVYAVKGRYVQRRDADDLPLEPDALRSLFVERGGMTWERLPHGDALITDLDPAKITGYVHRVGAVAEENAVDFLMKRGCMHQQEHIIRPTNAGVLLFASDVERFFPQAEITLVQYAGPRMSDEFLREDIHDTLVEAVRRAEVWLSQHMKRGSVMQGLERKDWTQFPLAVVREVLVNAVAHRDYLIRGEGIRITLFSDRLECHSPGRLPGHMTIENIADQRFSRNETLVQVMADYGLIERLGYGINRMIFMMEAAGLQPPVFAETDGGFVVTLYSNDDSESPVSDGNDHWRRMGLNDRQISAITVVTEKHRITNGELQEMHPSVSTETIRRDLADLVERNILLRIGDKRGAYYIMK